MNIIPDSAKIYGKVQFGEKSIIGEYSIIGYPYVESEKYFKLRNTKTLIGKRCIIGSYVIIYQGTIVGDKTHVEDFCKIGEYVRIGKNCRILYGAKVYNKSKIGNNSIIVGFCCERAKIGNNVRLFGALLHSHRSPHLEWDDVVEKSPTIDDFVCIGFGAKIIGGIRIGRNSYVTSGVVVTKNVPPQSIVSGVNDIIPFNKWKGRLKKSQFFKICK